MGITFKELNEILPHVIKGRKPILLRSRHGVGKSMSVYQFAKEMNLSVIERRASQMTEGDLLGLPKTSGHCTEWLPPDWLKKSCDEPVVLFIDELDRATQEVRQGFFELADSRKIAGWGLHADTLVFAAVNGGEHAAQYQVGEMDPAELDRWVVFDLEPSVDDWIKWGKKNNISQIILDFINENPKNLEHTKDFEPNGVYPSRRSWHRFDDCIRDTGLLEEGNPNKNLYNIAVSFLGLQTSIAFQDYVKNYNKQINPEDIIDKGNIDCTKDFDINEHSALVEKIKEKGWYEKKFTKKQLENLSKYFHVLPSEIAMKLFQDFSKFSRPDDKSISESFTTFHYHYVKDRILEIIGEKMKKEEKNATK